MKYATFELAEVDKINAFMQEAGKAFAFDGVKFTNDRVCFLYLDDEEARQSIEANREKSGIL
jgi:hypothetical protein